jgi:glycosyltransferase involved in cell wall biosynthesis
MDSVKRTQLSRIRFQIQPTVSHYREPLVKRLLASKEFTYDLVGRPKNSEASAPDRIASASASVLTQVMPLKTRTLGLLWWEEGQVAAVWRGDHSAYVLEGRIYTVSTWAAGALGKLRGRRVLLWGHGWKRSESGLKRLLRLAFYALVDGLLVYGDRAQELGTAYGVPAEKIHVIYNSLYSRELLPAEPLHRSSMGDRPTLIYSSRLTTRHRLDVLAEALSAWPAELTVPRVVIIGDGSERPRLEEVFARAGVEATFLGAVYDFDQLKEYYTQADVALAIGGAGLNVIQALGFGVPVVAESANRDSSPEIEAVIDGHTGRYFEAASPESLRNTLSTLLSAPAEAHRMGKNGLELVRERYTAEAHAAAIDAALRHFLEADQPRG